MIRCNNAKCELAGVQRIINFPAQMLLELEAIRLELLEELENEDN